MNIDIAKLVMEGDRFITTQDVNIAGLTVWAAPYTGSFECTISAGTILVARHDQVEGATGFVCVPEKYKELERELVPESDRLTEKYGGYYFVFYNEDIGTRLRLISRASAPTRLAAVKKKVKKWATDIWLFQVLLALTLPIIILVLIPIKPFIDLYKKSKLKAELKAAKQNKER